jgi:hypothetical protein
MVNGAANANILLVNIAPANKAMAATGEKLKGRIPDTRKPAAIRIMVRMNMFFEFMLYFLITLMFNAGKYTTTALWEHLFIPANKAFQIFGT